MNPNDVAGVLDELRVRYERELQGFVVGNLRLMTGGGIAGRNTEWFIRSIRGPEVRSRIVKSKAELRKLVRDYFPRFFERSNREAFGNSPPRLAVRAPRLLNSDGSAK